MLDGILELAQCMKINKYRRNDKMNKMYAKLHPQQSVMLESLLKHCRSHELAIKSVSVLLGFATVVDKHGNAESLKFHRTDNKWS